MTGGSLGIAPVNKPEPRNSVVTMNESCPLERAAEAFDRMMSGKARFRVVMKL
jgi:D-arabinose 1-dehydrogenase-like Zn-dependent alcohol dehydrogenase